MDGKDKLIIITEILSKYQEDKNLINFLNKIENLYETYYQELYNDRLIDLEKFVYELKDVMVETSNMVDYAKNQVDLFNDIKSFNEKFSDDESFNSWLTDRSYIEKKLLNDKMNCDGEYDDLLLY